MSESSQLERPADLWKVRTGSLWFNDDIVFNESKDDLERRAAVYADAGINHVILWSYSHFRWSYHALWPLINETIARIVKAFHRYGIYVTEHHSTSLLSNDPEKFRNTTKMFLGDEFEKYWPTLHSDFENGIRLEDGTCLADLQQVDGRTGLPADSGLVHFKYPARNVCYTNPVFRKAYLEYLETLYDLGIDGIMTDDLHWFADGHACACRHCREEFLRRTGHELPPAGKEWEEWHGNYDEPVFLAWLDFRWRMGEDFAQAVVDHYECLGLDLIRPVYSAFAFWQDYTAAVWENSPRLDFAFQECCHGAIIRCSWPQWAVESAHRFSLGRRRKAPGMNLFYPGSPEKELFAWALAMSWGTQYFATFSNKQTVSKQEKLLRAFEEHHENLLCNPRKIARIAFYDSRRTREMYRESGDRSNRLVKFWGQACYMNNLMCDMFQEEELDDRLPCYDLVILCETACMSDHELEQFAKFAEHGGAIVWIGRTASRTYTGLPRRTSMISQLHGINVPDVENLSEPHLVDLGNGRIVFCPFNHELGRHHEAIFAPCGPRAEEKPVQFSSIDASDREHMTRLTQFLRGLLPDEEPDLGVRHLPEGVLVSAFLTMDSSALVVHFLNASNCLEATEGMISHRDAIPFTSHAGNPDIELTLRIPPSLRNGRDWTAWMHRLEAGSSPVQTVDIHGDSLRVTIDPASVENYALLELRPNSVFSEASAG